MTRTLTRMETMGWIIRTEGKDRREKLISVIRNSDKNDSGMARRSGYFRRKDTRRY